MKKPSIPSVPNDPTRASFDASIKENIEVITGRRGAKIQPLSESATLSDVIAKLNAILAVTQG